MEKNNNNFFPALRFHENGGHLWFYGTHQGTYNFKTASSNAVKSCTHIIEDIQMKKRTEAFLFLLHNTFFNHVLCEKHNKNSRKFQILLNKKNQNV